MKKLISSFVLSAAVACGTFAQEQAIIKNVKDIFQQANIAGKRDDIRSAKLIYSVEGAGMPATLLMVRAENGERIRLDIITGSEHYVACRDGEKFWGYDKENGAADLTRQEALDMTRDTMFLPLPFFRKAAYKPLQKLASQDDPKRIKYSTAPLDGTAVKITVSINAKTHLLARVTAKGVEGTYVTSFRDYQTFDGVKIATKIQCSSPEGLIVMQLRSVNWNAQFNRSLFAKTAPIVDGDVALLKKTVSDVSAVIPAKRAVKSASSKEDALRKEIGSLDIQIKEKEEQLEKLEKLISTDHQDAVSTAKEAARPRYRYRRTWYYGGWSGRWTTSSREGRYQRKLARRIYKEGVEALKEYDKISEELTKLRIRRSDAQIELQKLQKKAVRSAAKATDKTKK